MLAAALQMPVQAAHQMPVQPHRTGDAMPPKYELTQLRDAALEDAETQSLAITDPDLNNLAGALVAAIGALCLQIELSESDDYNDGDLCLTIEGLTEAVKALERA